MMKEKNNEIEKSNQIIVARAEQLAKRIEALVVDARRQFSSTINVAMVYTYFEVGRYIIEDEQGGKHRAEYGKGVLKRVSALLTASLGKGWSVDTLEKTRRFFMTFSKSATPQRILAEGEKSATLRRKFVLSWNHYQILSHVDNPEARSFYEIEAFEQHWSTRYLQRQIGSGLYERLALSRDKDEVMRLATEGQVVEKPADIFFVNAKTMLLSNLHCPRMPTSMLSNMLFVCLIKLCFSRNYVNGLQNLRIRRTRSNG